MRGTTREWMRHRCRRWWRTSRQEIVRDIRQLGTPPNARMRRRALSPRPRCSWPPLPSMRPYTLPTRRHDTLDVLLPVVPVLSSSSVHSCSVSPRVFLRGRERQRTSDIQSPTYTRSSSRGISTSLITTYSPPPPRLLLSRSSMSPREI